jgi:guanylate kinase
MSICTPRRGFMFVLSSPSGAGKTTIASHVLEKEQDICLSISYTTRPKRPSEVHGQDYYFIDETTFHEMVSTDQFLEYAKVFGHYYGTPRAFIEQEMAVGKDVLFDIDWQGTQQLKQVSSGDLVSVFVLPPSMRILEERLRKRDQDSEDVVIHRMDKAAEEISHWAEYDYILINDDLSLSVQEVRSILTSERLKRRRQTGLGDFVKGLRNQV